MCEMNNTEDGINCRLDIAEEKISKLSHQSIKALEILVKMLLFFNVLIEDPSPSPSTLSSTTYNSYGERNDRDFKLY